MPAVRARRATVRLPEGFATVSSRPNSADSIAYCLEILAQLQRRRQLLALSVEMEVGKEARISLRVPAEEVEPLRRQWPVELSCPELDEQTPGTKRLVRRSGK